MAPPQSQAVISAEDGHPSSEHDPSSTISLPCLQGPMPPAAGQHSLSAHSMPGAAAPGTSDELTHFIFTTPLRGRTFQFFRIYLSGVGTAQDACLPQGGRTGT